MSSRVTTVIDCGTSCNGVGVFVAVEIVGTWYPPAAVTDTDVKALVASFGKHRALDLIWYSAWVNYMTRVADAFQLPLEKENVFAAPSKVAEKAEK